MGNHDGIVTRDEFLTFCTQPHVQNAFEALELPVNRPNLAMRLFEVLDQESEDGVNHDQVVQRLSDLMREGQKLTKDPTLLLLEVRALNRKLRRLDHKADKILGLYPKVTHIPFSN